MDTTDPPTRNDRSPRGIISQPGLSRERTDARLRRTLVSALAKSIRSFRKRPRFSSAWQQALRNLQQHDPKEYRNGLDFTEQLLRELPNALRRAAKDPAELDRLFSQAVRQGPSINILEEELHRLACCSGRTTDGVDPAWDAVYNTILLGPLEAGRPQPITRSFNDLLQVRGLNLRPEITVFLQREFPAQFAKVARGEKTAWPVWRMPAADPLNAGPSGRAPQTVAQVPVHVHTKPNSAA
ncbi:MAG: hypothetical protein ABSG59_23930 [Verrucomicrobiota bacterium]|jgi:hypothetical protein